MAYPWPLKPFDHAHPVRAYFNDPRISGPTKSFHFGVDISAPNGTPVYAVQPGVVHLEDARAVAVAAGDRVFGYWHVVPAVRHLERVSQHQLLGHVEAPWLHVHFAERSGDDYRNPLRHDALTPWTDTTRPSVTAIAFMRDGNAVPAGAVSGAVDVVAEAHDVPPVPVPAPWHGLPVTPAKLRWRVHRGGTIVRRLAHAGRLHQGPASAGALRQGLRARDTAEPRRRAGPLPLLPRPHLEHAAAAGRRLRARGGGARPGRQQRFASVAVHARERPVTRRSRPDRVSLCGSRKLFTL